MGVTMYFMLCCKINNCQLLNICFVFLGLVKGGNKERVHFIYMNVSLCICNVLVNVKPFVIEKWLNLLSFYYKMSLQRETFHILQH